MDEQGIGPVFFRLWVNAVGRGRDCEADGSGPDGDEKAFPSPDDPNGDFFRTVPYGRRRTGNRIPDGSGI